MAEHTARDEMRREQWIERKKSTANSDRSQTFIEIHTKRKRKPQPRIKSASIIILNKIAINAQENTRMSITLWCNRHRIN